MSAEGERHSFWHGKHLSDQLFNLTFYMNEVWLWALARSVAVDGNAIHGDNLRKQKKMSARHELAKRLRAALQLARELEGREVGAFNLLGSKAGCRQQHRHWDWDPASVDALNDRLPRGVVLACEDGARLVVFNDVHDVEGQYVELNAGDVLLFDGDVLHAGAQYEKDNLRLHVYLDVPALQHEPNASHFPVCDEIDFSKL